MADFHCAPENTSLLNPNEFRFVIHRAPYLNFFVQMVALPTITLGVSENSTPFTDVKVPGDHLIWDSLNVTFLVDEDLKGWIEMYNWMRGLGFPTTFEEYQDALIGMRDNNRWEVTTSPVSVFTATGNKNVNVEYLFDNAFPVELSAPTLVTTNPDQPVVTAKVRFDYTTYDVRPVK